MFKKNTHAMLTNAFLIAQWSCYARLIYMFYIRIMIVETLCSPLKQTYCCELSVSNELLLLQAGRNHNRVLMLLLQRSQCRLSHTGDGFCLRGRRRAAQWRVSPATWLSWGQSVQQQAMLERCTPSRASWPGTLRCDSQEDSTRHPGDVQRMFVKKIEN